jgi:hypothetical protein
MITCKCGGIVDKDYMTSGAERFVCRACGRYELFIKDLLTNVQNAYNAVTDNRKASDDSSLSRGAL